MKRHRLNCLVLNYCNVWGVSFPVSCCNATLCCCGILGKLIVIVVGTTYPALNYFQLHTMVNFTAVVTTTTSVAAITVEKSVGGLHSYCYPSCFLRILTKPS